MNDKENFKTSLKKEILDDLQPEFNNIKKEIESIKEEIKKTIGQQVKDLLEKGLK